MSQVYQIDLNKAFHNSHHHHSSKKGHKNRTKPTETGAPSGSRASARRFLAEAAVQPTPVIPKTATDKQVEKDLTRLNDGDAGAWAQLMKDIGGADNLSTYRTSDGLWSLMDLCGRISSSKTITLTNAATTLLDKGFQFQTRGPNGLVQNDEAPRYQWDANNGYCGETSFATAGLDNGDYISQYDARQYATGSQDDQLLLGDGSDAKLAAAMHLKMNEWNTDGGNTKDFLAWIKKELDAGCKVMIGLYTNENTFYGNTNPNAGQPDYDHIVTVTGISNGRIYFCDNGLYGNSASSGTPYEYSYPISAFEGTRQQANTPFANPDPSIPRNLYTLPDGDQNNYGVAIQGVQGSDETLPIHLLTNVNNEPNEIGKSNERPPATPVTLTGCITGLTPGKVYKIYVYDKFGKDAIPDSDFNKNSHMAAQCITFIATGSSYVFTNQIMSSDQIAYRVVPADGP